MYRLTCPECNAPLVEKTDKPIETCLACGWPRRVAAPDDSISRRAVGVGDIDVSRKRKRKRRVDSRSSPEGRGRAGASGYLIAVVSLLVLWAGLAALSFRSPGASVGLLWCGFLVYVIGTALVFHTAAAEGVDLGFWSMSVSRSIIVTVLSLVLRVVAVPVLAGILLVVNFGSAWKPALVLLIAIGMVTTGGTLAYR